MREEVKWGRAFIYGLKYLAVSAVFNVVGVLLVLSSLSLSVNLSDGKLMVVVDAVRTLSNLGLTALMIIGFSILVIGNVAVFMKLLTDVIKESNHELLW